MKAYINENSVVIAIGENDDLYSNCEPVEITEEEKLFIEYCKLPKRIDGIFVDAHVEVIEVPQEVHNHKLRLAMIHFGIMPSEIDMAIEAMTDLTMREKIYTLWNFAPMLKRADSSLNYMATQFEISQNFLDQMYIYANTLK